MATVATSRRYSSRYPHGQHGVVLNSPLGCTSLLGISFDDSERQTVTTSRDCVTTETIFGTFHSWSADTFTEQLRRFSAHTRNELAMIRAFTNTGDNLIDIGAHIGTFSIPFAQFAGRLGKVFAFDAQPDNFRLLQKNITANDLEDVIYPIHAVVAEDSQQQVKMVLPEDANSGMYYFPPVDKEDAELEITTVNIDRWYADSSDEPVVHWIKVDVEGAEIGVLKSCERLIRKHKPLMYVEVNELALARFGNSKRDIEKLLTGWGYDLFRNVGLRNSTNDRFALDRLESFARTEWFFDVLAVHSDSLRYPKHWISGLESIAWRSYNRTRSAAGKLTRRVRNRKKPSPR